jgi:hypothetical protein
MSFTNLEKTDMVFDLRGYFTMYEMNKRELGYQREDRILVAEDIPHEIQSVTSSIHFSINVWVEFWLGIVENHLIGPYDLPRRLNVVMICIHYFFRQIFEPAQNGNKCGRDRHRIGGALRCDFLLAEKVRNANDEGSSWKSAANKTHM